jgi:hypothetical protein
MSHGGKMAAHRLMFFLPATLPKQSVLIVTPIWPQHGKRTQRTLTVQTVVAATFLPPALIWMHPILPVNM